MAASTWKSTRSWSLFLVGRAVDLRGGPTEQDDHRCHVRGLGDVLPVLLPTVDRSGATRPKTPSDRLLADVAGVGALGLPSDIEINLDSDERLLG